MYCSDNYKIFMDLPNVRFTNSQRKIYMITIDNKYKYKV